MEKRPMLQEIRSRNCSVRVRQGWSVPGRARRPASWRLTADLVGPEQSHKNEYHRQGPQGTQSADFELPSIFSAANAA